MEQKLRIVVKVGTSTLAYATGRMNLQRVERMCKVLSDLKNAGHEIILVSSGAIGMATAGSPTVTLLRLHPNHHPHLRRTDARLRVQTAFMM